MSQARAKVSRSRQEQEKIEHGEGRTSLDLPSWLPKGHLFTKAFRPDGAVDYESQIARFARHSSMAGGLRLLAGRQSNGSRPSSPYDIASPPKPSKWCHDPVPGSPQKCLDDSPTAKWTLRTDLELMRKLIIYQMEYQAHGAPHAFSIATGLNKQDTITGSGGWAREQELPMSPEQPLFLASTSKVITAAAVCHAIQASGGSISFDSPIWQYFPKAWIPHPNFKKITVANSLQYRVGILDYSYPGGQSSTLESTRSWYTKGEWSGHKISPADIGKTRYYNNACLAWFRIMLFYMTATKKNIAEAELLYSQNQDVWHWAVSTWARDYVRNVFAADTLADTTPFGLNGPGSQTLFYPYPCTKPCAGVVMPDWLLGFGGLGWCISANDLSRFWYRFRRTGDSAFGGWSAINRFFNFDSPEDAYILSDRKPFPTFYVKDYPYPVNAGPMFGMGGSVNKAKSYLISVGAADVAMVSNCNVPVATLRDVIAYAWQHSLKAVKKF